MTNEHGRAAFGAGNFPQSGQPTYGYPSGTPTGQPGFGAPQPQTNNRTVAVVVIALAAVVGLAIIAVIGALLLISSGGKPEAVLDSCTEQIPDSDAATLYSDGKSIQFSTGKYAYTSDIDMLDCLLEETGAPSSVNARMNTTRALDGTQDAEWDGWSAFWTYHPDNGIDVTFTKD